ncbi:hypothetical protein FEM08_18350 [Flavobacterium gilvum]|nr:hypothetical protein FEM08_18350 [Flavobacterium gilvum]
MNLYALYGLNPSQFLIILYTQIEPIYFKNLYDLYVFKYLLKLKRI